MTEGGVADDLYVKALLAPCGVDEFLNAFWERKPLHLPRKTPFYYDNIVSNADLEALISSADMRYPAIQIARDGAYYPAEFYTRDIRQGGVVFAGVPDIARVQSEYESGATVVLPGLHRTWAPLRNLCSALANEFGHAIHANAYLTPGGASGFTTHYDTHDVFILQIGGRKHWRIAHPTIALPHRTQACSPSGFTPPEPCLELTMEPGDLLYLPRGVVHDAHATEVHSAHVTIGVTVYTWVELFSELITATVSLPSFRRALPPGFASGSGPREALKAEFARRLDELGAKADLDHVIEFFLGKVRAGRVPADVAFNSRARDAERPQPPKS